MNIKKNSNIQTWDGRTGEVVDIISKKANVLFSDGSRSWVNISEITSCENPRHSRAFVMAKAQLRKRAEESDKDSNTFYCTCPKSDTKSQYQAERIFEGVGVGYDKSESGPDIVYSAKDLTTEELGKLRAANWRSGITISEGISKKSVKESDISFGESTPTGSRGSYYQDILLKGKQEPIGVLVSSETSLLAPIVERYQLLVPDGLTENVDSYESEDAGYSFAVFDTLEDFLSFYSEHEEELSGMKVQAFSKFAPGKVDESLWDEAKAKVRKQRDKNIGDFTDRDWGLVNHIYQNMGGTFESESNKKFSDLQSTVVFFDGGIYTILDISDEMVYMAQDNSIEDKYFEPDIREFAEDLRANPYIAGEELDILKVPQPIRDQLQDSIEDRTCNKQSSSFPVATTLYGRKIYEYPGRGYIIHFLDLLTPEIEESTEDLGVDKINAQYQEVLFEADQYGGTEFHRGSFGGVVLFNFIEDIEKYLQDHELTSDISGLESEDVEAVKTRGKTVIFQFKFGSLVYDLKGNYISASTPKFSRAMKPFIKNYGSLIKKVGIKNLKTALRRKKTANSQKQKLLEGMRKKKWAYILGNYDFDVHAGENWDMDDKKKKIVRKDND